MWNCNDGLMLCCSAPLGIRQRFLCGHLNVLHLCRRLPNLLHTEIAEPWTLPDERPRDERGLIGGNDEHDGGHGHDRARDTHTPDCLDPQVSHFFTV